MAQPQLMQDDAGNVWDTSSGAPVFVHGPQSRGGANVIIPAAPKPTLPYEAPQAQANLTRTQQEINQANAQAGYDTRIKRAQAIQEEQKAADAASAAGDALGDPNLKGAARLASVPADKRELLTILLNNELPQLNSRSLSNAQMQSLLATAKAINPQFDPSLFGVRMQALKDFTGAGKASQAVGAVNRLASNLKQLKDISDKMGGPNLGERHINSMVASTQQSFEPGLVAAYDSLLPEIANQFDLIMKSGKGAPTISGTEEIMKGLARNRSEDERNAAMQQVAKAVHGAILPLKDEWNSAYGGNKAPPMWVSKEAGDFFSSLDPANAGTYGGNDWRGLPGLNGDGTQPTPPGGNPPPGATGTPPLGIDRTNQGFASSIPAGGMTRTQPNPEASALIDSMVAANVPYGKAVRTVTQQFPNEQPFSPDQYNQALAYHAKHPNENSGYGAAVSTIPLSDGQAFSNALVQNFPGALATRYGDAALGGIPSGLAGDQGAYFHNLTNQAQPVASMLGDIGGAVTATLGLGKGLRAGADALSAVSPFARKMLARPGVIPAAADELYGNIYGATQNPDHPVAGAAEGGAAMLAGNAAGRLALGPGLAAAGNSRLGKATMGMFGATPTPKLAVGDRLLANQAGKATPDILSTLDEAANLNLPYSLADSNPKLRLLAGSAARKSPMVRDLAENTIGPRSLGQSDRAISAIDTHLAPSGDLAQINADALTRARSASSPYYEQAMQHPAPDDHALRGLLDTPAGQSATREAYQIALNKGEKPGDLSFHPLEDGTVRIDGNPNWRTLQYMKQGVDSIVEKARDPATGKLNLADPSARGLQEFRTSFTGRLHALNPDFAKADAEFAKYAGQGSSAQMGASATSPRITPQTVQGVVGNMQPDNLPFYQQGYATSLANKVDNLNYSSDPYRAIYGSPAQRAKVGAVFPNGADKFGRINALEGDMSKTAYETLGGSPTAARAQADASFDSGPANLASDLAFTAATGAPPPSLIKRGISAFAGDALKLGLGKSAQRKAEQIGPALLDTDPAMAAKRLRDLLDLNAARKQYMAQARAAGGMFAAPLAAPFISN